MTLTNVQINKHIDYGLIGTAFLKKSNVCFLSFQAIQKILKTLLWFRFYLTNKNKTIAGRRESADLGDWS